VMQRTDPQLNLLKIHVMYCLKCTRLARGVKTDP